VRQVSDLVLLCARRGEGARQRVREDDGDHYKKSFSDYP
jgi:hypothetical protein